MKLEVGMYVRTDKGEITKIINTRHYKNETGEYDYFVTDKEIKQALYSDLPNSNVIKASYDIIDLIEEGDYVNGMPVYIYDNQLVINQKDGSYITLEELLKYCNIKSIVTKEMYQSVEYRVEAN